MGFWAAASSSATFDEPAFIAADGSFWRTGDLRMHPYAPPLAVLWLSLPSLFQKMTLPLDAPEWRGSYDQAFAERLLYWSGNDADRIVLGARLMNLALSVVLGALLWRRAGKAWGQAPAALALAFYAFCPSILGHASLATTDFPAAFFAVLAMLSLADFLEHPGRPAALLFGGLSAGAFLCKYSGVLLLPACGALLIFDAARDPKGLWTKVRLLARYGLFPGLLCSVLLLRIVPQAWDGFFLRLGQVSGGTHPTFLLGRLSGGGWRWYYAAAFLVKSTLPELAVLLIFAALLWRGKLRLSPVLAAGLALILVYMAAASAGHKQIGLRYVLPVYPMLAYLAAPVGAVLVRSGRGIALAAVLGFWQAASAAAAPEFLAYFNEGAGSSANGYRILVDSNLDWGQDLKRLAVWLREEGSPEVVLSYFGRASPEYYGIRAQQLLSHNTIQRRLMNSDRPAKEVLVVSATNLQGVYLQPPSLLSWLKDRTPDARVGPSLFVYDITRDAGAHRRLAEVYAAMGDGLLRRRELRRADILEKEASRPPR